MATAPMSNRRVKRPYGGFLRSKRRSGLDTLAMLEAASDRQAAPLPGLFSSLKIVIKRLLRRQ
jgi:hypothetical protein